MSVLSQFSEDEACDIMIYHYVEELVAGFKNYLENVYDDGEVSLSEFPFLVRIRFSNITTQKELVDLFKVSEGYTAKLLRKFEDNKLIERMEDPANHRKKIVKLTEKGIEKTDKFINLIKKWEDNVTSNLNDEDVNLLKNKLFILVKETENF